MNKYLFLVLSMVVLSGCYTVNFVRGPEGDDVHSQMHHNGLMSLVELSDPVNPGEICGGEWTRVTTYESVVTWLIGSVDTAVLVALAPQAAIDVWDPQEIEVECK